MEMISTAQWAKLVERHQTWLRYPDTGERLILSDALLATLTMPPNQDLRHARFDRCSFASNNLVGANLEGATFEECDLSRSYISGTRAHDASFRRCDLSYTEVVNCDLTVAHITYCTLDQTRFNHNRMVDIDWRRNTGHGLLYDTNDIIFGGHDNRGYLFYATPERIEENGNRKGIIVRAGCRRFFSLQDARRHWSHHEGPYGTPDLALFISKTLDLFEAMATYHEWLPDDRPTE